MYCKSPADGKSTQEQGLNPNDTKNESGPTKTDQPPVHLKKLHELREVMINYRNQPRGHSLSHHPHSLQKPELDRTLGHNHWTLGESLQQTTPRIASTSHHSIWM